MADYKMIPVDEETHKMLTELISAYEMPQRSYGAIVKKLAKADYERLAPWKLVGRIDLDVLSTKIKEGKGKKK